MEISADKLKAVFLEQRYGVQLARPDVYPTADQWKYIIEQKMGTIAGRLYRKFLVSSLTIEAERTEYHENTLKYFVEYASQLGADPNHRQQIIEAVYDDISSAPDATISVIVEARLFDAPTLLDILNHTPENEPDPVPFVARALTAYQPTYTPRDLDDMQILANAMSNLTPLGQIRTSRGIFSEDKRYICPDGHSNDINTEFCKHPGCGLNIFGLTQAENDSINEFKIRVSILATMIEK